MSAPRPLRVVAVSGSLRSPSSTNALIDGILNALLADVDAEREVIELGPLAVDLAAALTGGGSSEAVDDALHAVTDADLVVVASPIYRGSYTGVFKLFFDLLHQDALVGTPVLLAAGGGNDQHALSIDHELRPLFAFFRAAVLPVGVYARAFDYADGAIKPDGGLPAAIARAVEVARPLLPLARS